MEVVPQTAIRAQNKQVNELSSKGLTRKKSTPYKHCNPLPLRAKTKAPDSKEDDEVRVISEVRSPPEQTTKTSEQNNYGPSLQQQSLFMQWKQNAESSTYEKGGRIRMYETRPPSPKTPSPLDHQVAIRRLRDYKVQELKNECKKRQLPVSGAKPQLLERLRPFEKTILGMSPPPTPEPAQFSNSSAIYGTVGSPTHETQHKEPVQEVAYESVMQAETTAHCQHTLLRSHQQPFEQAR
nr:DNA-binding SAP domain containing protein [Haemonchus contortus]